MTSSLPAVEDSPAAAMSARGVAPFHPMTATCTSHAVKSLEQELPFRLFCELLDAIVAAPTKDRKLKILDDLWLSVQQRARRCDTSTVKPEAGRAATEAAERMTPVASSFYTFMRLLMPQLDSHRGTYGLKESKIAASYIDLFGLPPSSADAVRLAKSNEERRGGHSL